jgi:oligopeptide/dipeptide ABC transporter ATP-binding protein
MNQPLLNIEHMTTKFPTKRGLVTAVNDVSFSVAQGEILGIVGESGCGKSTVLRSILRLIAKPGRVTDGTVHFRGQDLLKLPSREIRKIRGKEISMIFQDPLSTLNPVFQVGEQIREAMRLHGILSEQASSPPWPFDGALRQREKQRAIEVMAEVGIPAPEARYDAYPHQFSGGMQQRALIAIGLICAPAVILADEPTTALDVTIQVQIINLMKQINQEYGTSIILVTHNLGLAAEFCDNIAVMYAGRIVEHGPVEKVVTEPKHPYTQGLLACLPNISDRSQKILPIPGNVPDLADLPEGCAFAPRCPHVQDVCWKRNYDLHTVAPGHRARCRLYETNGHSG